MWDRLKHFSNPFDARYEDMNRTNWPLIALRDTSAGLIVAMMAIPMAMGFAIASGLRPEHGILAGAVAGLVGALFGGSKYNVYGPVAALIPIVAGLMEAYRTPEDPGRHRQTAHYKAWRDAVAEMMAEPRTAVWYANVFPPNKGW